jgi:hypothetical protein
MLREIGYFIRIITYIFMLNVERVGVTSSRYSFIYINVYQLNDNNKWKSSLHSTYNYINRSFKLRSRSKKF